MYNRLIIQENFRKCFKFCISSFPGFRGGKVPDSVPVVQTLCLDLRWKIEWGGGGGLFIYVIIIKGIGLIINSNMHTS